ncbi:MAG: efflux RND transporter periplasmic adaptor subunit [Flavobacteriales bacterium]|nr:efflux RND transporter periplasmic adaptor subunit [Flavobacteriales bacterium]
MKKLIPIVIVLIFAGAIGFKLYSNKQVINEKNQPVDRSSIAVPVKVAKVKSVNVDGQFSLPAVLKPYEEVDITINTSGKVKRLNFNLGSNVRKGQVIGSIDSDIKSINLKNAELQAKKLKKDFQRIKELFEGNAATQVELDNAEFNYKNAEYQVESLKQQIQDGNLVSPINGVVVSKDIEVGEFMSAGKPAAHVVDLSKMKTLVMVSEKDVYQLKEGMKVTVTSDLFADAPMEGTISFISPNGDANHNYEVEVLITDASKKNLKAGTFVSVAFDIQSKGSLLQIPKKALIEGVTNPAAYVAKGSSVTLKKLVLGRDLGENIEVLSGLKEGELVVVSGQINLTESSIINQIK